MRCGSARVELHTVPRVRHALVHARRRFKKANSFLSGMYDILEVDVKDPLDFQLAEDDYIQFKYNFFNFVVENGKSEDVDEVLHTQHNSAIQ